MSEEIKKGGRIPKKNSEYYSKLSIRDSNTKLAKSIYGSLAVDCIQAAHERIGQADYFLFPLTDQKSPKAAIRGPYYKRRLYEGYSILLIRPWYVRSSFI